MKNQAWVASKDGVPIIRLDWGGRKYTGTINGRVVTFNYYLPNDGAAGMAYQCFGKHLSNKHSTENEIHDGIA